MKKIEAIIRKTRFEDVKEALNEAGIEFFSFWEVRGVGPGQGEPGLPWHFIRYRHIERVLFSIIVRDINLTKTLDSIQNQPGPGKLATERFSSPISLKVTESGLVRKVMNRCTLRD